MSEHDNLYEELIERVEKNFTDYKESLLDFVKEELIDMADKISAMSDAHAYMTSWYDFDEHELEFYLQFQNPLEVVAEGWCKSNIDLREMSSTIEYLYENSDDILMQYPLMEHLDAPIDHDNRRFMGVDLIDFLGKISQRVIIHYPNDFNHDKEAFWRAVGSENPNEKRLMWHVSSYGTHTHTEHDTFVRDTGAYNYWVDYRPNEPDMFGYAVEITGRNGDVVLGNVYEVGDYAKHAEYVRHTAFPLDSVSLTYSDEWGENAGKTITVPRREYDNDRHRLMSESGVVKKIRYHPAGNMGNLSEFLLRERAKRMSYPIGSQQAHLDRLTEKLTEIRGVPEKAEPTQSLTAQLQAAEKEAKAHNAQISQTQETSTTKTKTQRRKINHGKQ
jgi:hypothetical protein